MKPLAVDTETTGIFHRFGCRPFAISTCDDEGETRYWEWDINPHTRESKISREHKREVQEHLKNRTLVFHNAKFDILMLNALGIKFRWRHRTYDTGAMCHTFHSATHAKYKGRLKELSLHYLDYADYDEETLKKAVNSARSIVRNKKLGWELAKDTEADYWVPRMICKHAPEYLKPAGKWDKGDDPLTHPWYTICETYAVQDVERTMLLYLSLKERLEEDYPEQLERERKLNSVLVNMSGQGLSLIDENIKTSDKQYKKQVGSALKSMQQITKNKDFNPDSPIQLREVLFKKFKLPTLKETKTKEASTDKEVLSHLRDVATGTPLKFLQHLKEYKECGSALRYLTQYQNLAIELMLYPYINQVGTSTTRMSSSDPNGQNISKGKELEEGEKPAYNLRTLFGPRPGRVWYCLDYSQLQLRIFAYCTQEKSMIEAFRKGWDFHGFIASRIFNKPIDEVTKLERRIGKNVNFGFVFGASPKKIEQTAGVTGLWDTVCEMFPSAHQYMKDTKAFVQRNGYVLTPHGYPLQIPVNQWGRLETHKGVNYIVQGCEGDICKNAMILCDDYINEVLHEEMSIDFNMIFQVHDELIFEGPADLEPSLEKKILRKLKSLMEKPGKDIGFITPVDVEKTTTDWANTFELAV